MEKIKAERLLKALVDGVELFEELASRSGLNPQELVPYEDEVKRGVSLMSGFYKYGHENMKPAGLPPPPNLYLDKKVEMGEQRPEYYAFEAVQRNGMNQEQSIWTCGQFGVDAEAAEIAIDNVCMPWREINGWRSYAQLTDEGTYVLMDKPPVKLKRHLERLMTAFQEERG